MRRLVWITFGAFALIGASVAVAHEGFGSKSVKAVSATFTATTASNVSTSTCTAPDGSTYTSNKGTFTGAATSTDPTLNGPVTISAESLINTKTGVSIGTVSGRIRIDTTGGGHTDASFDSVYSNDTHIAGLAEGRAQDASLISNLSANYVAATGFTNGKLGGGTTGGDAVETSRGGCSSSPPRPEKIEVHGTVGAVSGSSITVAGVICTVNPSSLVTGLVVGDRVQMSCTSTGGSAPALVKVSKDNGHHDH